MSTIKTPIIGIDFGSTYTCTGVFQSGRVTIIPNEQGNLLTPSCIAFTRTGRLFGEEAKSNKQFDTIFHVKKIISLPYSSLLKYLLNVDKYFILKDDNGKLKIHIYRNFQLETFLPKQICAMILKRTKQTAQAYLGQKVTKAVLAVPACFNQSDRQAIIDAGVIAGFNDVYIINETSAAALAYGVQQNIKEDKKILIFNLGGLFLNISVVEFSKNGQVKVRSVAGDGCLGGDCFDKRLVTHCVHEFRRKYKKDLRSDFHAMIRLQSECENAKKVLSSNSIAEILLDSLFEGIDFSFKITRNLFEQLCEDLFRSILEPTENAMRDAKCNKTDIAQIVLIGGSTRIPKIQKLLKEFFNFKIDLCMQINPEEAVAYGTAVQAAIINGEINRISITDVSAHSLGVEMPGGIMAVIIKRNYEIPCEISNIICTVEDNQSVILIKAFEGEKERTENNNFLGEFNLTNIPQFPKGKQSVQLIFEIDRNGILHVSAFNVDNKAITVTGKREGLSAEEIEDFKKIAEQYDNEEQIQQESRTAYNSFRDYIDAIKEASESVHSNNLLTVEKKGIERICDEALEWLDLHNLANKTEINKKMKEYKTILEPVIEKIKSKKTHNKFRSPSEMSSLQLALNKIDEIEAHLKK